MKITQYIVPGLACIVAGLAGCASPGYKEGDNASGAMRAASAEATTAQSAVDATLASLNELMATSTGDLRPKYEAFHANMDKLESSITGLYKRTDSVMASAKSYLDRWERELKQVKNEDLRQKSEQRRVEVQKRIDNVKETGAATKTAAGPALQDLGDVRRVLGTDLTPGGIATVKDAAARAQVSAKSLREAAAKQSAELDALSAEITSLPAPAPEAAPAKATPEPQK